MLFEIDDCGSSFASVKLVGRLTKATCLEPLERLLNSAAFRSFAGVGLNCAGVKRVTPSGLAAFLETLLGHGPQWLGAYGLSPAMSDPLRTAGLLPNLPVFETFDDMRANPRFQACQLAHTTAILLDPNDASDPGLGRLAEYGPAGLLDVLGAPLITHTLSHLKRFGVQTAFLAPRGMDPRWRSFARSQRLLGQSLLLTPAEEGGQGAHSVLRQVAELCRAQATLSETIIVMNGAMLSNVNLAEAVAVHQARQADFTFVHSASSEGRRAALPPMIPIPNDVRSHIGFRGLMLLRRTGVERLYPFIDAQQNPDDIAKLQATGAQLFTYRTQEVVHPVATPQEYAACLRAALRGDIQGLRIEGQEHTPNVWVHETARIGRRLRGGGAVYVADNAVVEPGAVLQGAVSIGAGAHIGRKTVIRDSIILPGVHVADGAFLDRQIVAPDWSINHSFAGAVSDPNAVQEFVHSTPAKEASVFHLSA